MLSRIRRSPRNRLILGAALLAAVLTAVPCLGSDRDSPRFTNRALKGTYGFSFDGTAFFPNPAGGSPVPVVLAAVGWLRADGKGNFSESVRTLNLGGQVFHQTAVGTYQVDPNGTGSADFRVFDRDSGVLMSEESFAFVVDSDRNAAQAIATGLKSFLLAPDGVDLPVVLRIQVQKQRLRDD